ncbi:MAG: CPBP family intramembrane glutamic endopeptidase [Candidatus Acidiferrales bacterium]
MASNSKSWQLDFTTAVGVWIPIVVFVALLGLRIGYRGPRFGIAFGVAAALFAFEFFLACPGVMESARRVLGEHGRALAPLVPLFAVLIYTVTVTANWKMALVGAAYSVLPALLVASSTGKAPGTWEDYAAMALIWLPVEFRWMYRVFPYPAELTHSLTILTALGAGVAAFVLLRRMDGIGYAIVWRRGFGANVAIHFLIFTAIAVAVGIKIGFLKFDPTLARLRSLPLAVVGITFFTAWPEEFLFRGVLQNLLSRTFKNEWTGLAIASVIFGFAHILHAPYPNWKYVFLATIAGLFYGHVWMKTGSLFPGALVHALVDISWHLLFR